MAIRKVARSTRKRSSNKSVAVPAQVAAQPLTVQQRLRQVLDQLDNIFSVSLFVSNDDKQLAKDLWDVLTALRGPDQGSDESVKEATTGIIRRKAFPKTFKVGGGSVVRVSKAISVPDKKSLLEVRNKLDFGTGPHFRNHYERAFLALGLNRFAVNEDSK